MILNAELSRMYYVSFTTHTQTQRVADASRCCYRLHSSLRFIIIRNGGSSNSRILVATAILINSRSRTQLMRNQTLVRGWLVGIVTILIHVNNINEVSIYQHLSSLIYIYQLSQHIDMWNRSLFVNWIWNVSLPAFPYQLSSSFKTKSLVGGGTWYDESETWIWHVKIDRSLSIINLCWHMLTAAEQVDLHFSLHQRSKSSSIYRNQKFGWWLVANHVMVGTWSQRMSTRVNIYQRWYQPIDIHINLPICWHVNSLLHTSCSNLKVSISIVSAPTFES
jgi:hypothetical protein